MGKLVLIDGNAILHRAFHALPPLTTKNGEPINAVYGLISMLLRVIQDLKPTHIAVCFDTPEPTFRNKVFKEYQSQRPETMNELITQFAKARRVIEAFGIPYFEGMKPMI
jgi:DNA polymerase I